MASPFTELDRLVVERLRESLPDGLPLTYLFTRDVRAEVERIAAATGRDAMRILDARLQALRKAGLIAHDRRRGWRTVGLEVHQSVGCQAATAPGPETPGEHRD
jgi:hypothetical protein